jgi:hypothetical protein
MSYQQVPNWISRYYLACYLGKIGSTLRAPNMSALLRIGVETAIAT